MKKLIWLGVILTGFLFSRNIQAQGPPVTSDKPIMLGAGRTILKTLTEVRVTNQGTFTKIPVMVHYIPTANMLFSVHLPFTSLHFNASEGGEIINSLGDIEMVGKFQFYRKDQTGKTFRMVAKTVQTLPTGKRYRLKHISTGRYQSYLGIVAGLETIKYGIGIEAGYNYVPADNTDELRTRLGFGLPLLKPTYPVNQINLYFEYTGDWAVETGDYELLYAQGIQYAKGRLTLDGALQWPLVQTGPDERKRKYSIFLGARYVF